MSYSSAFRLDGKVALVTGAAGGFGAEIARAFAEMGAQLVVTDIADEGGRDTAAAVRRIGGTAECRVHDVTSEAQWGDVIACCKDRFGRLDVLVNNAGIEVSGVLSDYSIEDFRRVHSINVEGTFLGCKHALSLMSLSVGGHGGSIVNMSSGAAMMGMVAMSAYGSSKGAVRSFTKHAAVECARLRTGVRVNSIHPGFIRTPMGERLLDQFVAMGSMPDRAAADAAIRTMHPMQNDGEPRDVACAALYLASDASRWVTGIELLIDGGMAAT